MGLDMYLEKCKRVEGYTYKQVMNAPYYFNAEDEKDFDDALKYYNLTKEDINKLKGMDIKSQEVGYFRKFNALHNWMVENVQDEVDDCGYYEVTSQDLKVLLDSLHKIKDSAVLVSWREVNYPIPDDYRAELEKYGEDIKLFKDIEVAEELLPTAEGFFFGCTLYDDYYLENINKAIDIFENVKLKDDEVLLYGSSW